MVDAIVIGGGPAGCSMALQLAREGFRVRLLEKQTYPAHKLCGEFLSTEVRAAFRRLGVLDAIEAARPHPIRQAYFTTLQGGCFEAPLPGTALGLSRYTLDAVLFDAARQAGADVADGVTVRRVEGRLDGGFAVQVGDHVEEARLVVGAYGKRSRIDRTLARPFIHRPTSLVAFKAHYASGARPHTVELHGFPGGYCGMQQVEDGRTNVCWIGRVEALKAAGGTPGAMIDQTLSMNPVLAERFGSMQRETPFLSVSQVTFEQKGVFGGDVCMVGDTAGMIAPLCGDGMAMALRSAELAAPLLSTFLRGRLTASALRAAYRTAWRREFALRMRLGQWLHRASEHPVLAGAALQIVRHLPPVGQWLIRRTRGGG